MIEVKRVYEAQATDQGACFLVDRLWPRGVKKAALNLTGWLKEAAPSDELRIWFGHDPDRWQEFQQRYFRELEARRESWQPILEAARSGKVTLLYAAKDTEHNNAVALKKFLEERL